MSAKPKLARAGYRGIWGDTLTAEIARDYVNSFVYFLKARKAKNILIGRDARVSGGELLETAMEVLQNAGFNVTNIGLAPTPTVLFLTRELKFDGAIIITASHNPIEYNGLKFVALGGTYITDENVAEINSHLGRSPVIEAGGKIELNPELTDLHVKKILENVNVELIKSKNFKVVLDPINSAGSVITKKLLQSLGCDLTIINEEQTGLFAHMPEPLAKNLGEIGEKVGEVKADVGFVQDPDADRLVLVDETGQVMFEEYSLILSVLAVLSKTPGDIVINLSTSRINEDLALRFGGKTFRTKIGEGYVTEELLKRKAVIGGEGSGGIIYPKINAARDSLTGIALVLELMAESGKKLSTLWQELPILMLKKNYHFGGDTEDLYERIKKILPGGTENKIDGLRLDFPDLSWLNIRPSNTEPLVRLMVEAKTKERAEEIMRLVDQAILG